MRFQRDPGFAEIASTFKFGCMVLACNRDVGKGRPALMHICTIYIYSSVSVEVPQSFLNAVQLFMILSRRMNNRCPFFVTLVIDARYVIQSHSEHSAVLYESAVTGQQWFALSYDTFMIKSANLHHIPCRPVQLLLAGSTTIYN